MLFIFGDENLLKLRYMKNDDVIRPVKTNESINSFSKFGTPLSSKTTRHDQTENETGVIYQPVNNEVGVNKLVTQRQHEIQTNKRGAFQLVTTDSIGIKSKNLKKTIATTISVVPENVAKSISLSTRIPQKLKHIESSINDAHSILNLVDNWDDDGAYKVPKNVYNNAILFLKRYALFILNDLKIIISAPEINPVKDGSIDLEWHTPNARMLINVNNTGKIGYYGDNFNDLNSIKGKIAGESVQTFLAVWMTKLTI